MGLLLHLSFMRNPLLSDERHIPLLPQRSSKSAQGEEGEQQAYSPCLDPYQDLSQGSYCYIERRYQHTSLCAHIPPPGFLGRGKRIHCLRRWGER